MNDFSKNHRSWEKYNSKPTMRVSKKLKSAGRVKVWRPKAS